MSLARKRYQQPLSLGIGAWPTPERSAMMAMGYDNLMQPNVQIVDRGQALLRALDPAKGSREATLASLRNDDDG